MKPTYTIADLESGDHLCWLYETEEEQRALFTPFLCRGLERGEKMLYIGDARAAESVLGYLQDNGLDVEPYLASGQLRILSSDDAYMRGGVFDPDGMIALLQTETEQALAEGHSALRVISEMAWTLRGLPGSERLIEYEARLNEFLAGSQCLVICQCDRRRFAPEVLLDLLRAHPMIVVGTEVCDNFYYIRPAELLSRGPEAELRQWLENLAEHKRTEETYQALVEQSLQGLVIIQDFHVVFANPIAAETVGYTVEELMSLSPEKVGVLLPPEDQMLVWERYQNRLERKPASACYEYRLVRKDGTVRWVEAFSNRIEYGGKPAIQAAFVDITQRKWAEEALRESEEMYKTLVKTSPDAVTVTDLEGYITDVSQRTLELYGAQSANELIGKNSFELIAPEDRERAMINLHKTLGGEFVRNVEYTMLRKDGACFIGELSAALVKDADGKPKAFIATTRDVTGRKRAEEALRESEDRYRAVSELISNYAYAVRIEPDGTIVPEWATEGEVRITGFTSDEVVARGGWQILIHPDDMPVALQHLQTHLSGQSDVSEYRIVTKSGEVRWVRDYGRPVWDEVQGRVVRIYGALQDITERKRLEREIEERRLYLESVLAYTPDAVVTLDAQHNILEWNPGAEKLYGYTPEEVAGRNIDELITGSDARTFEEATGFTRQVLVGEPLLPTETIRYRKDGSSVDVIASGAPILIEGRLVGMVAVYTDITERKRLEAQLRQAQKMEALGQLAGGICHDFNNLLTPISGFAELLLWQAPEDSRQHEYLQQIKIAAERAAALTRQLRLFTRHEAGERHPVQMNSVVKETHDLLEHSIPKEITIQVRLAPYLWAVEANPSQISQVLMNLCLNACDAMPDGGTLTLETRNATVDEEYARRVLAARPGRYVRLSVSDTGVGMSPEVQARLFEPFFTTKEVGKGTGLGLAVVYGIVRGHGGFIQVYSEERRGSTFHVYLPAKESEVEAGKVEGGELPTGAETILVVDDEETVRALARRVLERCGYTVLTAENGVEALQVYQAHRAEIGLVMLDVVMPGMGGRECLHRLQELDPAVRVLISTGYTVTNLARELLSEGALGLVEKPFKVEDLATMVRAALDG